MRCCATATGSAVSGIGSLLDNRPPSRRSRRSRSSVRTSPPVSGTVAEEDAQTLGRPALADLASRRASSAAPPRASAPPSVASLPRARSASASASPSRRLRRRSSRAVCDRLAAAARAARGRGSRRGSGRASGRDATRDVPVEVGRHLERQPRMVVEQRPELRRQRVRVPAATPSASASRSPRHGARTRPRARRRAGRPRLASRADQCDDDLAAARSLQRAPAGPHRPRSERQRAGPEAALEHADQPLGSPPARPPSRR